MKSSLYYISFFLSVFVLTRLLTSCARIGSPDGGWYDEKPPYVVGASPKENGTDVKTKKIKISFNEFIKLDNPTEKVMVSPPQHEQPEIKSTGKNIYVELQDTLIPHSTYTIDFSDAISDNNEGNPMGNYTYTFSTGDTIDTLSVSGYVLESENLEPIKGILVGLYPKDSTIMNGDTLKPFTRISRTDSRGQFIIRGVAPGSYHIGALQDQDNNYMFSQKSEKMAFTNAIIVPTCGPDTRQDTIWKDQHHIKDIKVVSYTHFRPDDIALRAFTHKATDRYYLKAERKDASNFTLFFTASTPDNALPELRLLNAPAQHQVSGSRFQVSGSRFQVSGSKSLRDDPFLVEHTPCSLGESLGGDTITYWLKDTALVHQDTLQIEMRTLISDTLGVMRLHTDTLEILSKTPYAKRLKAEQEKIKEWKKSLAKKLKKAEPGEVIDTVMPRAALDVKYCCPSTMVPNGAITIDFPTPLERFDTAGVHLYVEQDSLWYRAPFVIERDSTVLSRKATLYTDWIPGANYSFEVDSLAFTDIYGVSSGKYKSGIQVATLEDYGTLFVNISGADSAIVQLLNGNDGVVMSSPTKNGTAEFYYISPGTYYIRCFIDRNGNGVWDTGNYYDDLQPEEVYYDPECIECKAKWDLTRNWNITAVPLYKQKPLAITKQKPEADKTIKKRNAERARSKGIVLPENLQ